MMGDALQQARNSLDVLDATVKHLILKHGIAQAKLVTRRAEVADLKKQNELLTNTVNDLAAKIAEAEKSEKNEQT